jgi:hypothetical protein
MLRMSTGQWDSDIRKHRTLSSSTLMVFYSSKPCQLFQKRRPQDLICYCGARATTNVHCRLYAPFIDMHSGYTTCVMRSSEVELLDITGRRLVAKAAGDL